MTTRSISIALAIALAVLVVPRITAGQQAAKIPRIGFLSRGPVGCPASFSDACFEGLRDFGYVAGRTIIVERRCDVTDEEIPGAVREFVEQRVDLIVASTNAAAFPAKQATATIPIVVVASHAPVETGLVASLARPGGNVTGTASLASDLNAKRIELLKEIVPRASRIAFLYSTSSAPGPSICRPPRVPPGASTSRSVLTSSANPVIWRRPSSRSRASAATPYSLCPTD